ncbi:MAG TPA: CmpA/NrtA family ABC transporter substrate-binding protein [Candidatus Sulfotelmatobacter sp.]|jgi:nitrate/nitrite transport system substrate-binding protein|nr:CmpA/NrtA family ABC transporter substrate-binding protein [Candidatus Sulfotelmatobacter sp.]
MERNALKIGFIPLCDSAPLIVAKERGFFAEQGLSVELSREFSWSSIRDKLAVGLLDAAQMLAPMVLSATLGLGNMRVPFVTAMAMNQGGNAITLGQGLLRRLRDGEDVLAGLLRIVAEDRAAGLPPLTFAMVYPFSMHNYELRLWLAGAGIDPDRDIRLVVVPPPLMVSQLAAGNIAGYCVGEPWNALAERMGLGSAVASGRQIWDGRMEKVLGVRQDWAETNPETHRALLRAVLSACRWVDRPENRPEAAEIIAHPHYLAAPLAVIREALEAENGLVFHHGDANFPWRSQGLWMLSQMRRWGQLSAGVNWRGVAEAVFRSDLYRVAAGDLGFSCPRQDYRVEGEGRFDPQAIPEGEID